MHRMGTSAPCAGLLGFALLLPRSAVAAWPTDPLVNVPFCTATGERLRPTLGPDGTGGAIVSWSDGRGLRYDIYSQRVQGNGQLGGDAADVPG